MSSPSENKVAALDNRQTDEKLGRGSISSSENRNVALVTETGEVINASGHRDQLNRQYGIWSICGLALTVDNAWVALGGSVAVSINNGGPPGVLYELLVACFYYGFIAASIAELASAIPSAGGVYHWASICGGPRYGRVLGFFTGSLNFFGWIFDLASLASIAASASVEMYHTFHPDLDVKAWHVYVAYLIVTWGCAVTVIFANRLLPVLNQVGLFLVIVGGFVTIIVVAAMPAHHASNASVWSGAAFKTNNLSGWSDGVAFLTGVLNGAFVIGTPDGVTHMAEELPDPKRSLPKAVAAQMILGTITSFCYGIALFYGVTNLSAVTAPGAFPLAQLYLQATGSKGATFGLLLIITFSLIICVISTYLTLSRIFWSLARDNATPFAKLFSSVNERLSCPIPAVLLSAILCTAFGAIQLGSKTAFTDLVGSFIILTTGSFGIAIAAHLFTNRRVVPRGPFWMGDSGLGHVVNALALLFIVFFDILYCLPFVYPPVTATMNYNSVILVGILVLTTIWWFAHAKRKYPGPRIASMFAAGEIVDINDAARRGLEPGSEAVVGEDGMKGEKTAHAL